MHTYKGVKISEQLQGIIQYMKDLDLIREALSVLGQQWDLLTILGQMSGTGTDMTTTRKEFNDLTNELISRLGEETLKKYKQTLSFKSQVTVDIVIRNLFERTADIGFLATDADIIAFLENQERTDDEREALVARFKEYVAKYSVYSDIILLDTDGNVVCRMKENQSYPEKTTDSLLRDSLESSQGYVETFKKIDLVPEEDCSLLYSYKVESPNSGNKAIGALVLLFRFENEMEGIFKNLVEKGDWTLLTLLDSSAKVIASSDPFQIPVGTQLPGVTENEFELVNFAGRSFLSKTVSTNGYEGFLGLGWMGNALLPLDNAFEISTSTSEFKIEKKVLESITDNKQLFSDSIRTIPVQADRIQAELERTVWNGNLPKDNNVDDTSKSARKVLLREISSTGSKTKSVFETSIENLHETVVTRRSKV